MNALSGREGDRALPFRSLCPRGEAAALYAVAEAGLEGASQAV